MLRMLGTQENPALAREILDTDPTIHLLEVIFGRAVELPGRGDIQVISGKKTSFSKGGLLRTLHETFGEDVDLVPGQISRNLVKSLLAIYVGGFQWARGDSEHLHDEETRRTYANLARGNILFLDHAGQLLPPTETSDGERHEMMEIVNEWERTGKFTDETAQTPTQTATQ